MIRHKNLVRAKYESELFVRNFVAGVDDGMIATVGLLAGVSFGDAPRNVVILTGIVAILVEAFSSAVGTILSEHSVEEYQEHKDVPLNKSFFGGLTMFISYVCAGLIPLAPYIFLPKLGALYISVALTLLVLAVIAYLKAKRFGVGSVKEIFENLVIASLSIVIGLLAGYFIRM
jgi:VIT1/CCC1 family predicted Fe2+/Mn2+ transporter